MPSSTSEPDSTCYVLNGFYAKIVFIGVLTLTFDQSSCGPRLKMPFPVVEAVIILEANKHPVIIDVGSSSVKSVLEDEFG